MWRLNIKLFDSYVLIKSHCLLIPINIYLAETTFSTGKNVNHLSDRLPVGKQFLQVTTFMVSNLDINYLLYTFQYFPKMISLSICFQVC